MLGGFGSSTSPGLANGGTVDGDLIITGDFKVQGAGSFAYDEIIEGTFQLTNASSGFNVSYDESSSDGWKRGIYFNVRPNRGFHFKNQNPYGDFSIQDHSGNPILFSDTSERRIGIGTASPSKNLHIAGSSEQNVFVQSSSGNARVQLEGTTFADIIMTDTGGGSNAKKIQIRQGDDSFKIRSLTDAGDVGNEMIHLDIPNNRIGIGTDSPSGAKLHIAQSADSEGLKITGYDDRNNKHANLYITSGGDLDITASGHVQINGGGNLYLYDYVMVQDRVTKTGNGTLAFGGTYDVDMHFLGTGDAVVMAIDNGNKHVGIGTSSPQKILHVTQTGTGDLARFESTGESFSIQFMADDSGTPVNYQMTHNGNKFIHYNAGNVVHASLKTGEVGIGTDSPEEKLSINNGKIQLSNQQMLTFSDIGDGNSGRVGIQGDEDSDFLRFRTDNANRMAITNTGVGINTNSPTHKLHVLSTDNKAFLLDRNTSNNPTSLNEFSSYYSLSIKNRASGTYLNFGGDSTHTSLQATDGAGSATAKNIVLNPYGGNIGIGETAPTQGLTLGSGKNLKLTGGIAYGISEINRNANNQYTRILGGNGANANQDARIDLYGQNSNFGKAIFNYGYSTSSQLQFQVNGNDKIIFKGNGNQFNQNSLYLGTLDGTYTNQHTSLSLYHGVAGYQASINYLKSGLGLVSEIKAYEYELAIKSYEVNRDITFYTSATSNNPVLRMRIDENSRISLSNNDAGSSNTVFGMSAGNSLASGSLGNVLFGESAGASITSSDYNTFVGHNAGRFYGHASASRNVAVGFQSMYVGGNASTNSASSNTAVGYQSLYLITTGYDNVAVGTNAGDSVTTGVQNTFLGRSAGQAVSTQHNNTFIGFNSGLNQTGTGNVAVGNHTMKFASGDANYSVAVGGSALYSITTGDNNIAVGTSALESLTTGGNNVAVGYQAGYSSDDNDYNTFVGHMAGYEADSSNIDAINNVYIGAFAGRFLDDGTNNVAIGYDAMASESDGAGNVTNACVAIGRNAMAGSTSSEGTIVIGHYAGDNGSNVTNNSVIIGREAARGALTSNSHGTVAIGYRSLTALTSGARSVAIGYEAGLTATTIDYTTIVGHQAGLKLLDSTHNTLVGYTSGWSLGSDQADNNTFMGAGAGSNGDYGTTNNNTANNNVGIGKSSMGGSQGSGSSYNFTGDNNVGIGVDSLKVITSGQRNVSLGSSSGIALTSGSENILIGQNTGKGITTGGNNTYVGHAVASHSSSTGHSNTLVGSAVASSGALTGNYNVGMGRNVLQALTSGSNNIALGYQSGDSINTGSSNVILGKGAMVNATSQSNCVVIGADAGFLINNDNANGTIAIGYQAGYKINQGTDNTVIGKSAMYGITTGDRNVAIGALAMGDTNAGVSSGNSSGNVAIGNSAMGGTFADTASDDNIAIGKNSLSGNLDGASKIVAIGAFSGDALTVGGSNVLIGDYAGSGMVEDRNCVAIGRSALIQSNGGGSDGNPSDTNNTAVGAFAGDALTNGANNVFLGANTDGSGGSAVNQIVIGTGATGVGNNTAIIGNSSVTDVYMGDNGSAWSTTSDGRLKENVEDWNVGLDAINNLRIVSYNFKKDNPYKYDSDKKRQGIIAQEAQKVLPEMIKDDGEWLSANQEPMIWALVNAVQELSAEVNQLKQQLKDK